MVSCFRIYLGFKTGRSNIRRYEGLYPHTPSQPRTILMNIVRIDSITSPTKIHLTTLPTPPIMNETAYYSFHDYAVPQKPRPDSVSPPLVTIPECDGMAEFEAESLEDVVAVHVFATEEFAQVCCAAPRSALLPFRFPFSFHLSTLRRLYDAMLFVFV